MNIHIYTHTYLWWTHNHTNMYAPASTHIHVLTFTHVSTYRYIHIAKSTFYHTDVYGVTQWEINLNHLKTFEWFVFVKTRLNGSWIIAYCQGFHGFIIENLLFSQIHGIIVQSLKYFLGTSMDSIQGKTLQGWKKKESSRSSRDFKILSWLSKEKGEWN